MFLIALAGVGAAAAAETHGEASAPGLPQLDPAWWPSQIFWLAIFFGVLYWLMSSVFLPKIGATIEERRDRIADDLDQAAEFRQQAEDAERAYKEAVADATAKAQSIAAQNREELASEMAELSASAEKKAEDSLAHAEERIAAMKADASAKVREAAVETTRAVVAALIDETPTAEAVAAAFPPNAAMQ